jgi:subtilisin family serine protease
MAKTKHSSHRSEILNPKQKIDATSAHVPSKEATSAGRIALGPDDADAPIESTDHPAPTRRYVISHLLSIHPSAQQREDAAQIFNSRVDKVILSNNLNVVFDSHAVVPKEEIKTRRVVICDTDELSIQKIASQMTADTVIEPELLRVPAVAYPAELLTTVSPIADVGLQAGTGNGLMVTLCGPDAAVVAGATAYLSLSGIVDPSSSTVVGGISGPDGVLTIPFDPNQWRPALLAVEPASALWTFVARSPQSGQTIQLRPLPEDGKLGWWQLLSGSIEYDESAGKGVKIGIVDSGVGPHPYLDHVTAIGAFIDGAFSEGADQGRDVQQHGTHVSGIIAARPAEGSGAFGGVAAGSDVFMARIFTATGGGNQGDVANAIDTLSGQFGVDVINMSITGAPSAIEHDAVVAAFQRGTVCVCAAGNQSGAPVGSPAAYPECIAIAALGLLNQAPADSMAAFNIPLQPDKFTATGIFITSFSNVGPQLFCSAPGNGIISTVPSRGQAEAPYVDMSGTSMSSPLVAGILANLLSKESSYLELPRDASRAIYAKMVLARHALSLGLNSLYQGRGLARLT